MKHFLLLVVFFSLLGQAETPSTAPVLLDKTQEDESLPGQVRTPDSSVPTPTAAPLGKVFKSVQSIEELNEALKTESEKKVVVYFSSTKRCPPCQQLAPYAVRFAEEKKDQYTVFYVDTTDIMGAAPNPPTESFQRLSKFFYKYMKQGKLPNVAVLNFSETESPPWVPEPFQLGRANALFKNLSPERKTAALEEENEIKTLSGGEGKLAAPDATDSLKKILELR